MEKRVIETRIYTDRKRMMKDLDILEEAGFNFDLETVEITSENGDQRTEYHVQVVQLLPEESGLDRQKMFHVEQSAGEKARRAPVNVKGYVRSRYDGTLMPYIWRHKGRIVIINPAGNAVEVSLDLVEFVKEGRKGT